jgi:phosphonate transport system substrate-binding protein
MRAVKTWWTLLAALAVGFLAACGGDGPTIDFEQIGEEPSARLAFASGEPIRMAVAPVLSPLPTFTLYQELADYVAQKLDRPVELLQGKTYAEINDLVKSGDVTVALVCTNPYVQGHDDFGMELLVAPEVNGELSYYSLLIVRREFDVGSLGELSGHTFAFSDPLSNTGRLAPVYQLALKGETPDSFFGRTIFTYAHDNSIRAVADGIVDAAAVDSLVYDYLRITEPDVVANIKVIEKWGPYGINPVVVNPNLDPQLKVQLRDLLLRMDEDKQGAELLQQLMVDRFVVVDDSIYDSVREMRAYLQERSITP